MIPTVPLVTVLMPKGVMQWFNLTDDIWLYEGDAAGIRQTLRQGRNGLMPAQKDRLREDKIHLLTAYIYQLSQE